MMRGLKKISVCLILIGLVLPFQLLADEVDQLYSKAASKYHELYKNRSFSKKEENWLTTIKQFLLIYQNYPDHPQAPKSLYNIGNLYRSLYQINQQEIYLDRSNITFRLIVRDYLTSNLADDAQYLLGENYELYKKDEDLALIEYKRVLDLFPDSNAASKAREKLVQHRSDQDISLDPLLERATTVDDLSQPRFGGLEKEQSAQQSSVLVSKVDYWSTIDWSRMVINLKDQVRYKYHLLHEDRQNPQKRLYIDLINSHIPPSFKKKIAADDGLISQARIAQFDKSTVRVVLDIQSLDKIKVFHINLPNQYKIVIDIIGKTSLAAVPHSPSQKPSPRDESKKDSGLSLAKVLGLKVKTIVIDPGHGGKDPGAIAFGIKEKTIVLDIAKRLHSLIKINHPEVNVLLTRSRNRFIELEARTAFANQNKGDLFISIHVNASTKKDLSGLETYFLNLTTDDDALNLAAKENQTSLKSISDLQAILNDLMANSKIKESRDLAEVVHNSLVETLDKSVYKIKNLGVKQGPFTVLIGSQMPSILIEAGFLSNWDESRHLLNDDFRQTIANGIYSGIKTYLH